MLPRNRFGPRAASAKGAVIGLKECGMEAAGAFMRALVKRIS